MATPSTPSGKPSARGLRDSAWGRLAILAALLLLAALVARGCGGAGDVSKEEAVRIAVEAVDFEPKCHQVRAVRRGIKSDLVWNVSLWTLAPSGNFDRISVVVVDGETGRIIELVRRAAKRGTPAQCVAPV